MKRTGLAWGIMLLSFGVKWQSDLSGAEKIAQEKHELILLNFSGSDWCGPCVRMHQEIFESDVFTRMADTSLVMMNADFPRSHRHRLDPALQHNNDLLAEKYDPEGKFPFTLLLDAGGNVLKTWDGYPDESADEFAGEISGICDSRK